MSSVNQIGSSVSVILRTYPTDTLTTLKYDENETVGTVIQRIRQIFKRETSYFVVVSPPHAVLSSTEDVDKKFSDLARDYIGGDRVLSIIWVDWPINKI